MKNNGNTEKQFSVEQLDGGYIITPLFLDGPPKKLVTSFEDAVNALAFSFGLICVGEKITLVSDKDDRSGCE